MTEEDFDKLSVMESLIRTMTEAYKSGLITEQVADNHVSMYAQVIFDIMNPKSLY